MGLVVTPPSTYPITLIEAKQHLREESDSYDDQIDALIVAATAAVENETRRALISRTATYTIDYEWPECIVLPLPPLQSVQSIQYVDQSGATQTLASSQYLVNISGMEGRIEPACQVVWPSVRAQMSAISVAFTCGYASAALVPQPLKLAMLFLISHWYDTGAAVVVAPNAIEMPLGAQSLMFPYRVFY